MSGGYPNKHSMNTFLHSPYVDEEYMVKQFAKGLLIMNMSILPSSYHVIRFL